MRYKPMLARAAEKPFSDQRWLFEAKWDGIRGIAYVYSDSVRIDSRSGREITRNFPELQDALLKACEDCVLDGEIVLVRSGKQDFQTLMERFQAQDDLMIDTLSSTYPATFIVFDILEIEGKPVIDLPLYDRKKLLAERVSENERVVVARYIVGEGEEYFKAAVQLGFEGIMAKKLTSTYQPGIRSNEWLKIKKKRSMDVVVTGFEPGKGGRWLGSLKIGAYKEGKIIDMGKVGTGFSEEEMETLGALLSLGKPFVIEVEFQDITKDGKLRMPRFIRIRPDKPAEECKI